MIKKGPRKQNLLFEKQLIELDNKWKRALADYANLEKRVEKEKREFVKFSKAQLLVKLLSILDDLQRCESHLKDEGLTLTINRFKEILEAEGVEEIEALNEDFNPNLMEVTEMVKGSKNKVLEVILKGYLLNNKIIRPAKVKVGGGR